MGWTIGMPSLKLNNTGAKSKHCGSFSAVAGEALEERQGHDVDIDHERSNENVYSGIRSAAELQEYSRKHVEELSAKQVAAGGRKIRNDAVVMCATIIKPPAAMMNAMSREDQIRFFDDARRKLAEIVGADNIKSTVIHFDEQGSHLHVFWEPMTEDGRLCAKEMHNLQFLGHLNREMPEYLRSCGWDVSDCKAYDQAQEALKSEQERSEERSRRGRSSASFKADMEREKVELQKDVEKAKVEKEALEGQIAALRAQKGPIGRIGPLRQENDVLKQEKASLEKAVRELEEQMAQKDIDIKELGAEVERLQPSIDDYIADIERQRLGEENQNLQKEVSRLQKIIETIKRYLQEHAPAVYNALKPWFDRADRGEHER